MTMDIMIPNVDISILRAQQKDLMDLIWNDPDSLCWGLVELCDAILDQFPEDIDNDLQAMLDYPHNYYKGK